MECEEYEDEDLDESAGYYTLEVNSVKYEEMAEAPPRERASLARTVISTQMNGPKK